MSKTNSPSIKGPSRAHSADTVIISTIKGSAHEGNNLSSTNKFLTETNSQFYGYSNGPTIYAYTDKALVAKRKQDEARKSKKCRLACFLIVLTVIAIDILVLILYYTLWPHDDDSGITPKNQQIEWQT